MLSPQEYTIVHLQKLNNYITGITANTIVHGKLERLAVERFIRLKNEYIWNQPVLERVLKFFSLINIVINGKVQQLELFDYNVFWLANLYGLYRTPTIRLFDQAYISVAKKNVKTLTFLICAIFEVLYEGDGEVNADVLLLAGSKEQAYKVMLKTIADEILPNSPALKKKFKITRNVLSRKTNIGVSTIAIKSSEASTIQGGKTSFCLADEYAVWDSSELIDKVRSGMVGRVNPLLVCITTAASNLQSPAKEMQDVCEQILNGKVDNDTIFTQIFSFDSPDEIELLETQPELYRKPNPGLGKCVPLSFFLSEFQKTKSLKSARQTFLTDNCNHWTNDEIKGEIYIDDAAIVACMTTETIRTGSTIQTYYGVDLSRNKDLGSVAELHYTTGGTFHFNVYTIFPNNNSKKIREFGSLDLSGWFITPRNPNGYIYTSDKPVLDEDLLLNLFKSFKEKQNIRRVGFDPHLASQVMYKLEKQLGLNCIHVKQNWTLSQPISFLERLIYLGKVKIVRNPVVRWNFQNCSLEVSKGMNATMRLTKKNREAIDCVIAMVVCLAVWMADNQHKYNDVMKLFDDLQGT